MPSGEIQYRALYSCTEIYYNSTRIIPNYDVLLPDSTDEANARIFMSSDDDY
jgi:hypothetical protein